MAGHDATVVLIHSSASSGRQWRSLSQTLSGRYAVVAPDLCGYRASDDEVGYTFADDLARVRSVIDDAHHPVHLVGHSYGGLLCAVVALEQPEHLRSLTLIEPVCFHLLEEAGENAAFAQVESVKDNQKAAVARGDLLGAAQGFVTYWMGADAWEGLSDERRELVAGTMPKVAREWSGAFEPTTRLSQYGSLDVPALIVRAADTTLSARTVVDLLLGNIEGGAFSEVASGGHMSPVTNSEPVNAAVSAFLANL